MSVYEPIYAIVDFLDELVNNKKCVELVPISWLHSNDMCYYPDKKNYKNIEQWVKQQRAPEKNWAIYKVFDISKAGEYCNIHYSILLSYLKQCRMP